VPLRGFDGGLIGVLELLNKRGGPFTAADEELALTLASLTGITLQRQILFE
jgi:GAF domain-containing protein